MQQMKTTDEEQKSAAAGSTDATREGLRLLVQEAVEVQVRKEHQLLKESVTLAAKIIGAAAALFLAVFTIFGITTWGDIKKEAISVVKAQTEDLLKKSDSEANVKENLTELLNRTVVAAQLAGSARNPGKTISLAANDWERLRTWLKVESLPLQDFMDTLKVLDAQDTDRKTIDANRLLAEMLNPPDKSPYSWIQKQPEKRESILRTFKDRGLGFAAAELIVSTALTESIKVAAAEYVQEVAYSEGVDRLLEVYSRMKDGPAKRKTLVACLALRPDHPGVVGAYKTLLTESPTSHSALLVGEALTTIPSIRNAFSSESEREAFRGLAKTLLAYAVKNGIYFVSTYRDDRFSAARQGRLEDPDTPVTYPYYQLMMSTSKEGSASGVGSLDFEQFQAFDAYWKLLAESANAGDLVAVQALLPRKDFFDNRLGRSFRRARFSVSFKAEAGAQLLVSEQGGPIKSIDVSALKEPAISPAEGRKTPGELEIAWIDPNGQQRTANIKGLKGKGYVFSLQRSSKAAGA